MSNIPARIEAHAKIIFDAVVAAVAGTAGITSLLGVLTGVAALIATVLSAALAYYRMRAARLEWKQLEYTDDEPTD